MENKEIKEILEEHKKWLDGSPDGIRANLSWADLYGADLRGANLSKADLSWADLSWADLYGANLSGANLENVKINYPIACPEEGRFIGFKKSNENYIIKLEITKDAKKSSATARKCRCSKARVIGISTIEGEPKSEAKSKYDSTFIYRVGEIVEVNDFDENRWNECSTGIHFFITRQEAIDY